MTHSPLRHVVAAVIAAVLISTLFSACGSPQPDEFAADCALSRSELGPFASDQPLGATLSGAEAEARAAAAGYDSWLEIAATGTWDLGWDDATQSLGTGIHRDLAWLDVGGEITGLYLDDEVLTFADLRVSRSFQGKIEHSHSSLFVGIEPDAAPNLDAGCVVTSVVVGTSDQDHLLDLAVPSTEVAQP